MKVAVESGQCRQRSRSKRTRADTNARPTAKPATGNPYSELRSNDVEASFCVFPCREDNMAESPTQKSQQQRERALLHPGTSRDGTTYARSGPKRQHNSSLPATTHVTHVMYNTTAESLSDPRPKTAYIYTRSTTYLRIIIDTNTEGRGTDSPALSARGSGRDKGPLSRRGARVC